MPALGGHGDDVDIHRHPPLDHRRVQPVLEAAEQRVRQLVVRVNVGAHVADPRPTGRLTVEQHLDPAHRRLRGERPAHQHERFPFEHDGGCFRQVETREDGRIGLRSGGDLRPPAARRFPFHRRHLWGLALGAGGQPERVQHPAALATLNRVQVVLEVGQASSAGMQAFVELVQFRLSRLGGRQFGDDATELCLRALDRLSHGRVVEALLSNGSKQLTDLDHRYGDRWHRSRLDHACGIGCCWLHGTAGPPEPLGKPVEQLVSGASGEVVEVAPVAGGGRLDRVEGASGAFEGLRHRPAVGERSFDGFHVLAGSRDGRGRQVQRDRWDRRDRPHQLPQRRQGCQCRHCRQRLGSRHAAPGLVGVLARVQRRRLVTLSTRLAAQVPGDTKAD